MSSVEMTESLRFQKLIFKKIILLTKQFLFSISRFISLKYFLVVLKNIFKTFKNIIF